MFGWLTWGKSVHPLADAKAVNGEQHSSSGHHVSMRLIPFEERR